MTAHGPAAVIVLAAGEGTRMRTATPKMLNEVCGRPMLGHVLAAARELRPQRLILVVSDLRGQAAETRDDFDAAYQDFQKAFSMQPKNEVFKTEFYRVDRKSVV